jgi:hypothetical protein
MQDGAANDSRTEDLLTPSDATLPDLMSMDAALPPDLASGQVDAGVDLKTLDLAIPDLATPDLSARDFAMPDLAQPDLATVDLSAPDLRTLDLGSSCADGVKNGQETDVDCGGPSCPKCHYGKACQVAADCLSGKCIAAVCVKLTVSFAAPVQTSVGGGCHDVVAGDWNRDGAQDFAVAATGSGVITLGMNNGAGTFAIANVMIGQPYGPWGLVAADLNQDGLLDLAFTNNLGANGTANGGSLLGNGDGTFQPFVGFPGTSGTATSIGAGDLNSDGRLDLIALLSATQFEVLLADAAGGFQPAIPSVGPNLSRSLAIADINLDGKGDLVVGSDSGVYLLPGNGFGGFPQNLWTSNGGLWAVGVAVLDLNGDKKPDVATAGQTQAWVLPGNGTRFQAGTANNFANGTQLVAIASADFNLDDTPDLVVADSSTGSAMFLLNNGVGGFNIAGSFATGAMPWSIAPADFTGDGKPDLVVSNGTSSVALLVNTSQ